MSKVSPWKTSYVEGQTADCREDELECKDRDQKRW